MQKIIYRTQQHLNTYAKQGLRVLMMAKRVLSENEYNEWAKRNQEAELSLNDREKKLMKSYSEVEKNLVLLGTLIEVEGKDSLRFPNLITTQFNRIVNDL